MSSIYIPKYFSAKEFVHPSDYAAHGERCFELIDSRIIIAADKLREKFGATYINTWAFGGPRQLSGLRPLNSTIGAKYSQHKFGRALDLTFRDVTVQEVYAYILAHSWMYPEITCVENIAATPTWLHIDCRWHSKEGIWIVNP